MIAADDSWLGNCCTSIVGFLMPLSPEAAAYPRPLLRRRHWTSLNGRWDFAIDADGRWRDPTDVVWNAAIEVPFAPETPRSGIGDTGLYRACWYRRRLEVPRLDASHRLLLHFGAVDYAATVWIDDVHVGGHEGGYTPFTIDITEAIRRRTSVTLVVRAEDDPHDLEKPRGKQDWQRHPHSIWYPRTSGIWQTVWLEPVPATRIGRVRWTPSLERWEVDCAAWIVGDRRDDLWFHVTLRCGDVLADDAYLVVQGEIHRRIALSDPGIDDFRNELLWHPGRPSLIGARLRLTTSEGEVLDEAWSYTALRGVGVDGDRFVLNGRPYQLRLVLDQGYWPESGMTAPDDQAFRRDIELVKAMGFNGVRLHQKIEDPRFLYWADRLGLLVWAEMPSCYRFTQESILRATREWMAAIMRDASHPSIVTWVPFNESWGVPNLPANAEERDYVHALYRLTKTLDPTRPVVGNDGWESVATDIIGIHDYDADPSRLEKRYRAETTRPRLFARERPGGRVIVLEGDRDADQPVMLTEFGGIACATDVDHTWGYSRADVPALLSRRYRRLLAAVHRLGLFAGFCYTQFTDTYQEANGLLYADRTPKFPLEEIAEATTGAAEDLPGLTGPGAGLDPQSARIDVADIE